jgi:uncharacterized protein Yka (UPF0111/DUF47 family)
MEACIVFRDLVRDLEKLSPDEIKAATAVMKACEKKGDEAEAIIINALNKTFITPIDREDIHMIAINIDKALDMLTSISNRIEMYGISRVPANLQNFGQLVLESAETLKNLMLDFEKKRDPVKHIDALHTLENRADYLFYLGNAELFKEQTDPIQIIKLKEVYEYLEAIIDEIDHVGKIVRIVLIKQG